jgi:hypothetical protein
LFWARRVLHGKSGRDVTSDSLKSIFQQQRKGVVHDFCLKRLFFWLRGSLKMFKEEVSGSFMRQKLFKYLAEFNMNSCQLK